MASVTMNHIYIWIAIMAVCSFFYTATSSVFTLLWTLSTLYDTLSALRTRYPNGRPVGIRTRQLAMREALVNWTILVLGQYVAQTRLDRLLVWVPFYNSFKVIGMGCFLYQRSTISQKLYGSYLRIYIRPYEPHIDLAIGLVSATITLIYHFTLVRPLHTIHSALLFASRRFLSSSASAAGSPSATDQGLIIIDSDEEEIPIDPIRTSGDKSPLRSSLAHRSGRSKTSPVRFAYANDVATYEPESPPMERTRSLPERMKNPTDEASNFAPPLEAYPSISSALPTHDISPVSPSSNLKRAREISAKDDGSEESDDEKDEPARSRRRLQEITAPIYPALPSAVPSQVEAAPSFAIRPPPAAQPLHDVGPIRSHASREERKGFSPYPKTSPRRVLGTKTSISASTTSDRAAVGAPHRVVASASSAAIPRLVTASTSASSNTGDVFDLLNPTMAGGGPSARSKQGPARDLTRSSTTTTLTRPGHHALAQKIPNRIASSPRPPKTATVDKKGPNPTQAVPKTSRYTSSTASSISRSSTLAVIPAASTAYSKGAAREERARDRGRSTAPSPPPLHRTLGTASISTEGTRPMHKRLAEVRGRGPRRRIEVLPDPVGPERPTASSTLMAPPAVRSGLGKRKAEEMAAPQTARPAGLV